MHTFMISSPFLSCFFCSLLFLFLPFIHFKREDFDFSLHLDFGIKKTLRTCISGNILNQVLSRVSNSESVYCGHYSRGCQDAEVTIKDKIWKEEFNLKGSHLKTLYKCNTSLKLHPSGKICLAENMFSFFSGQVL